MISEILNTNVMSNWEFCIFSFVDLISFASFNSMNKFFESALHKACRWADFETVKFLLDNEADALLADDQGRLPLHDVCWRKDVDFAIAAEVIRRDVDMLRRMDRRGQTPLAFASREHWRDWCRFLHEHRDEFWPLRK